MNMRVSRGAVLAAAVALAGLSATPAYSADIYKPAAEPAYTPPSAREVASGWFLGGLVGYGLADIDLSAAAGNFDFEPDGAIGGGMLGWNYNTGRMLFGVEGDILAGDMEASQVFGGNTVNASVDWLAGLRARAGVYAAPGFLLFGTLGYGWADIDLPVTGATGGAGSEVFSGIQYGGGAEVALSERWNLRLDYIYTDLDSETITYPGGAQATYDPDVHQARAGLILKF